MTPLWPSPPISNFCTTSVPLLKHSPFGGYVFHQLAVFMMPLQKTPDKAQDSCCDSSSRHMRCTLQTVRQLKAKLAKTEGQRNAAVKSTEVFHQAYKRVCKQRDQLLRT